MEITYGQEQRIVIVQTSNTTYSVLVCHDEEIPRDWETRMRIRTHR